ncbi:hypothetical protein [Nonomuraea sp. NPDC049784]|uniref:hypothetical protein n=1 Tax=Nonomuraea sp. NPDC049784 TaxID=3154361 RepID=UPI0033F17EEC
MNRKRGGAGTSPRTLAALLVRARTLDDAITADALTLTGLRATAERFLGLFAPAGTGRRG